jgi:hypothetical protein
MSSKKLITMKYRVHRIEVKSDNMQESLENFINKLDGEVISVIPNVKPIFLIFGGTARVDFLLVVEKQM